MSIDSLGIPNFFYGGFRVLSSSALVEEKIEQIKRSWKKRLFSLPWKPWKKMEEHRYSVPKRVIVRMGKTIVVHPVVLEELKEACRNSDPKFLDLQIKESLI